MPIEWTVHAPSKAPAEVLPAYRGTVVSGRFRNSKVGVIVSTASGRSTTTRSIPFRVSLIPHIAAKFRLIIKRPPPRRSEPQRAHHLACAIDAAAYRAQIPPLSASRPLRSARHQTSTALQRPACLQKENQSSRTPRLRMIWNDAILCMSPTDHR